MMKSTKLLFAPALVTLMALTGCKGATATEIKVTKVDDKALASEKFEFKANSKYVINADCSGIETIDNSIEFSICEDDEFMNPITGDVVKDDTIKITTTKALTKVTLSESKKKEPGKDEYAFDSEWDSYCIGSGTLSKDSTKLKIEFTAKKDISGYAAIIIGG